MSMMPKRKSVQELGNDFDRLRERHDQAVDAWEKARLQQFQKREDEELNARRVAD